MDVPTQASTPTVSNYGTAVPSRLTGRGVLALGLSMLVPGLGQAAAGRFRRGVVWFALSVLFVAMLVSAAVWPGLVPVAAVVAVVAYLVNLSGWIDAFRTGARSDRPMLGSPRNRYLVGLMAGVLGLLGVTSLPLALCVRHFLCEAFVVPTVSMAPTLAVRDRFIVHKLLPVHRWDVIAFYAPIDPRTAYTKRVVGLPGETIEIDQGVLRINGTEMTIPAAMSSFSDPKSSARNATARHPLKLRDDEYFVVGDNTTQSYDARYWPVGVAGHQAGAVPKSAIIGVATYTYWPVSRWRKL